MYRIAMDYSNNVILSLCSGFEDHPTLFYWVSGCATATSVIVAAVLFNFVRIRPRIEDKRRAEVSCLV